MQHRVVAVVSPFAFLWLPQRLAAPSLPFGGIYAIHRSPVQQLSGVSDLSDHIRGFRCMTRFPSSLLKSLILLYIFRLSLRLSEVG